MRVFVLKFKPRKSTINNRELKNIEYHFHRTTSANCPVALAEQEAKIDEKVAVDDFIAHMLAQAKLRGKGFVHYVDAFLGASINARMINVVAMVYDERNPISMQESLQKNRQDTMRLIDQLYDEYTAATQSGQIAPYTTRMA